MKTRIFENPVKFAQSVKVKVDGEYVSLLELLQNADIELDETPTSGSDKAVSSGGVFNALQEKQNQISITENDDGSVDITIPEAGESGGGSSGETLRVIDINNIMNDPLFEISQNDDGDTICYLDLTKNGEYLIINPAEYVLSDFGIDYCTIKFGFIKGFEGQRRFSKPIVQTSGLYIPLEAATMSDTIGMNVSFYDVDKFSYIPLFIKVTTNCVYIGNVFEI